MPFAVVRAHLHVNSTSTLSSKVGVTIAGTLLSFALCL
jgi:hypothetical protein